ncbi:hypothetical protein LWI29_026112 [Acer saccharum]|uniref:Rx N-terminal domain-containing protein n=1 Tax=Acer saccharum TaxID=4024 RepID=A0AA39RKT9_ACESA|nr:hypothetical protein LWI29_026112 [Acer saccharum]
MVFVVEAIISALLSASLQVLFDRISPRTNLIEFFHRHKFDEILFKNLETTLLQVNAVLSDAEEKQITNLSVRQWIDELKDAAYHTVDLLDEIHSLALAESQASNSSALNRVVQKSKSKLEKMTEKLENIVKHKDVLGLKESFSGKPSLRLQLTSLVDETEVYGRGTDKKKIMDFLLSVSNSTRGSSISELGGLLLLRGKLTILELQNVRNVEDTENAKLKDKENVEELEFNWSSNLQFDDFIDYPALQTLHIESCNYPTNFTLNLFSKLKFLQIQDCRYLRFLEISEELHHQELSFFQMLEISECPNMELFSGRGLPAPNLTTFSISNCNNLRSMPEQMHMLLSSLQTLNISGCPRLVSFPDGGLPPSLQILTIKNCVNLTPQIAWGLRNMASLTCLAIECAYANVTSFPDEGLLPASLTFLQISEFPVLKTLNLSGLQHITLLKDLQIHSCNQLQILSDGSLPSSLSSLTIAGCSLQLKDWCKRDRGIYWDKISHIPTQSITATN